MAQAPQAATPPAQAIKAAKRPAGVPDHVRVFNNDATGRTWHVSAVWEPGQAGPDTVVRLTISTPGGEEIDRHGATFTQEELQAPNFDAQAALGRKIAAAIERADRVMAGRTGLQGLKDQWAADQGPVVLPPVA